MGGLVSTAPEVSPTGARVGCVPVPCVTLGQQADLPGFFISPKRVLAVPPGQVEPARPTSRILWGMIPPTWGASRRPGQAGTLSIVHLAPTGPFPHWSPPKQVDLAPLLVPPAEPPPSWFGLARILLPQSPRFHAL